MSSWIFLRERRSKSTTVPIRSPLPERFRRGVSSRYTPEPRATGVLCQVSGGEVLQRTGQHQSNWLLRCGILLPKRCGDGAAQRKDWCLQERSAGVPVLQEGCVARFRALSGRSLLPDQYGVRNAVKMYLGLHVPISNLPSIACRDPKPCDRGFYCPDVGMEQVLNDFKCLPGFFCPGGSHDGQQEECPSGSFCPEGSSASISCAFGTYSTQVKRHGACDLCTPGSYCGSVNLTSPSGPCAEGFFCRCARVFLSVLNSPCRMCNSPSFSQSW